MNTRILAVVLLSLIASAARGYVTLDNVSLNNYTFKGDTTYYIRGPVDLTGTTIIEGGTVLKYTNSPYAFIRSSTPLVWQTDPYRMAVFTSWNDRSVGEQIAGMTANHPTTLTNTTYIYGPTEGAEVIKNARFAYAGIAYDSGSVTRGPEFWDCQFVCCRMCCFGDLDDTYFHNVLAVKCGALSNPWSRWYGEHITADACDFSVPFGGSPAFEGGITNSIFTAVMNMGNLAFNNNLVTGSSAGIYQPVGAGNYYLAPNSLARNAGTTGIDPATMADIQTRTTYPPSVLNGNTFGSLNLSPIVPRDTDTPDLGYHYAPLDYLCTDLKFVGSDTLTLSNGVAVGLFGDCGFSTEASDALTVISRGKPDAMNRLCWYPAVQEQALLLGSWMMPRDARMFYIRNGDLIIDFRFTDVSGMGLRQMFDYSYYLSPQFIGLAFQDCWLRGVSLSAICYPIWSGYPFMFQNNLIERSTVNLSKASLGPGYPVSLSIRNNLFRCSSLLLTYQDDQSSSAWAVTDNLFDSATNSLNGSGNYQTLISRSNNGFYNTPVAPLNGTANVLVTDLSYATGPLGPWYIGSCSPTLVDQGSRTAAQAGLTNYTERVDQTPEGNTQVDIGFHYVALNVPVNSTGTNFWVAFSKMDYGYVDQLSLAISGPDATIGTVSIPGMGFNQPFTITPGQVTTIDLPNSGTDSAMIRDCDTIGTKGIHVTAGLPVSVYALVNAFAASEGFTGYPSPMLGTNYCVMARAAEFDENFYGYPLERLRSQFAVLATEDNTIVTITPSATADIEGHSGTSPFTVNLQQGQTYQLRSSNHAGDVTGTFVSSTKPTAVFAGANLAFVPDANTWAGNPLVEEQLPVLSWGRQALGFPLASRLYGDTYRVLAANDGTDVITNGILAATLQKGQFYDTIFDGPVVFSSSQPIQVAQFSNGSDIDGIGDPFEMLVPPAGHYMDTYVISVPAFDGFTHYMNLLVEQSAIGATLVDGQPVSTSSFSPIGSSGFYGAQIPVTSGAHTVHSSKPVGVLVYGFGWSDGYGYVGGVTR